MVFSRTFAQHKILPLDQRRKIDGRLHICNTAIIDIDTTSFNQAPGCALRRSKAASYNQVHERHTIPAKLARGISLEGTSAKMSSTSLAFRSAISPPNNTWDA